MTALAQMRGNGVFAIALMLSHKRTHLGRRKTDVIDPNVWTGCISQLRPCGIAELADMYPAY
jgi:hypothetical protein